MLDKMEKRKNEYKEWSDKLDSFLDLKNSNTNKVFLQGFRRHLYEVRLKNFPKDTDSYLKLKAIIEHAIKLSSSAKEILDQQKALDDLNEQITKSNRLKNDLRRVYSSSNTQRQSAVVKSSGSSSNSLNLRSLQQAKSKKLKDQEEENTKLEFDEFKQFVDEINYLPCLLPETDLINQLHNRCDTISKSIQEITNYTKEESEGLSSDFIEQLIFEANCISIVDFDQQLDIVKYKLDEIKWIEQCKQFLNAQDDNRKKKHQIDLQILDTMIESSKELLVSTNISQELIIQLQTLKEKADDWIMKAKDLIDLPVQLDDSSNEFDVNLYEKLPTFGEFQILVKEAEEDNDLAKVVLNPHLDKLIKIITNADDWLDNYKKLFPDDQEDQETKNEMPFFDQIEDLFNTGKIVGCKMRQMTKLYSIYLTFKNWREKLYKHFIRKNSIYNLVNVLLPRTKSSVPQSIDLVEMSSKVLYQQLKKIYYQQSIKDQNKIDWFKKQLDAKMSRDSIEKAYKEAIRGEEICMKEIREKNLIKLHSTNLSENSSAIEKLATDQETEDDVCDTNFDIKKKKFCICGKKPLDWMISCYLCNEFYHKNCLKLKKTTTTNSNNNNSQLNDSSQDLEKDNSFYLCVLCGRSKRPNLEIIINLSEQLNNQKIRIFENELLRCLIARANCFRFNLQKELNARRDLAEAYSLVVKAFHNLFDNSNENEFSTLKKRKTGQQQQQQQQNLIKKLNFKINLTDQTKHVLYNLIWDCSLLQVTVNEFKYLWEIYCIANCEFKTSIFITSDATNFTLPIISSYLESKVASESKEQAQSTATDKKRKVDLPPTKQTKQTKKQKIKKSTNQNGKSKKDLNSSTNSSSSESEQVCCLNDQCLRPFEKSKEIDWVFCEGCQDWLHFLCAGIDSSSEINEIDKFYCSKCLDGHKKKAAAEEKEDKNLILNSSLEKREEEINSSSNKSNNNEIEAAKLILSLGQDFTKQQESIEPQTCPSTSE